MNLQCCKEDINREKKRIRKEIWDRREESKKEGNG
jgi:hypothetical protein